MPLVNVRDFKIEFATLELVDAGFASRHRVLPLMCQRGSLVVACDNPLNLDFAQDLRFATGMDIVPVIADPDDLKARISKEYNRRSGRGQEGRPATPGVLSIVRDGGSESSNAENLAGQLSRESGGALAPAKAREEDARVSDNTLVRLINQIIVEAHTQGASDIHIESNPGTGHTRIRFRRDGELEDYLELPPAYRNSLISRLKIMAELNIAEHRQPQDGKIEFRQYGPLDIELRVAVIPTANNLEDMVLRILSSIEPLPLEQLRFSPRDLTELRKMIGKSCGLILVCGPTGSGKTTTLHSVLHEINKPDVKIWTAEDPIEITQPGLRQVQVQPKIDWTFAAAMRSFLRADPDVIMVGEMRDSETTKIGIEASLTGHLVLSTLHTNSAAESVVRLLDLGMDPFNFADALIGVLSQRLARTLCPACKRSRAATQKETNDLLAEYCADTELEPKAILKDWQARFGNKGDLVLWDAVGCKDCRKGYKGRVGVYELLVSTPAVKNLVRSRATVPQIVQAAVDAGMRMLRHDAIDKLWQGILDLQSARAVSS
jgi:type II secretory ATPase GspE/PulE/Tfp pilus assembly ATPase PilB-like protein